MPIVNDRVRGRRLQRRRPPGDAADERRHDFERRRLSIFYGPPGDVAERTVTAFEQTLSNDGTATFVVEGTRYVLAFGTVNGPDSGPLGTFTLESVTPQGGAELSVTLRSPTTTTVPTGLSVTCLP
jgi:hypothetical protein